jgi:lysophospholipase L1-like esterase
VTRLGVLAFGDSITNGGGELQWGVALQSWALWVARGLGLPFTTYAVDGALARDVLDEQIPAFLERSARPDARYDLGCLYVGVNDVRWPDWDPDAFAAAHAAILDVLAERCDRLLLVTLPLALGRPRAAGVSDANRVIEAAARARGALVLDLRDFGARNLVMADRVHPTAFGQVWIAERALAVLAADGMDVRVAPSALIRPAGGTRKQRLQGDWTYVYRTAKEQARVLRGAAGRARRAARAASARSGS